MILALKVYDYIIKIGNWRGKSRSRSREREGVDGGGERGGRKLGGKG